MTYAEVHSKKKSRRSQEKESYVWGIRGYWLSLTFGVYGVYSGVRGGGKCPEEEHTTCSGGPTIVIVTSAVYGEREYFYFMKIKLKYKVENVKMLKLNNHEKTVKYP